MLLPVPSPSGVVVPSVPVSVPSVSSAPSVVGAAAHPISEPTIHAIVRLFVSAIAARGIKPARYSLRLFHPTDRHTYEVSRFLSAFSPRSKASRSELAATQITNLLHRETPII